MGGRHDTIGIKQALRLEWMRKAADLAQGGSDAKTIRRELHDFLAGKKDDGHEAERSDQTRTFAVNNLMNIWVTPATDLVPFRNASLAYLRERPSEDLATHWGMISAAYPFWFNVAKQTGRLLALQEQVTQAQIITRLKERYGDRPTVSRYARFVIRSFVAWGVLKDSEVKGCYKKSTPRIIIDRDSAILLVEAALQATPEAKAPLSLLLNSPALFPFQLPGLTGEFVVRYNGRMEVARYALDEELMGLNTSCYPV